jgi:muramidase (phage lysozyme)
LEKDLARKEGQTMGIGPIPNFPPMTAVQPAGAEPELPAVVRVESASRAGGDSPGRRQPAGRQDEDFSEAPQEELAPEPSSSGNLDGTGSSISIFV